MIELLADINDQLVTLTDRVEAVESKLSSPGGVEDLLGVIDVRIEDVVSELSSVCVAVEEKLGIINMGIEDVVSGISLLETTVSLKE
ncbi:MAG: hypothetical protein JFAIHJKO_01583 [Pyrinomonadaceae bacterium]|nr:hypothetical protein [Pyrinomonadaceae bacterium]